MKPAVLLAAASLLALPGAHASEVDFALSGKVDAQLRAYQHEGAFAGQGYHAALSAGIEPELYWQWNEGNSSLTFKPFYRLDQRDDERSHGDIRELLWVTVGDGWELRTGVGKVFWGVTEFQHLVDIINQTDSVESADGEEKLGQPMVNLSLVRDWGIVDAFLLPGFRERTFAGREGRLRPERLIDADDASYESGAKEQHVDVALRWSHSLDIFDIGIHWFHGTGRDPLLLPSGRNDVRHWRPYYEQIEQLGLDAQATVDAWLWKFEAIYRDSASAQFAAAQLGVEYTFYGVADTPADIGLLVEYGWDERRKKADSSVQNDLFVGARLTLNDASSTDFLVGAGYDLDYHGKSLVVEGNHRMGDQWKLVLDGRFFRISEDDDPLSVFKEDNYLQLTLEYYF